MLLSSYGIKTLVIILDNRFLLLTSFSNMIALPIELAAHIREVVASLDKEIWGAAWDSNPY